MKLLLDLRKKLKGKKPRFVRHDAHKKKRVSASIWRRPKGRQNKMRLHKKGYARDRSTGFGSPLAVKYLSREGFTRNVVYTQKDIDALTPKTDGVILARTLGARKKLALIDYAQKKGFTILELRVKEYKDSVEQKRALKANKKSLLEAKKKKKDSDKKASKKGKEEVVESKESSKEKKDSDKKELDKLLTKGDIQ
jgi:large subunit ribosomal protein L32e